MPELSVIEQWQSVLFPDDAQSCYLRYLHRCYFEVARFLTRFLLELYNSYSVPAELLVEATHTWYRHFRELEMEASAAAEASSENQRS